MYANFAVELNNKFNFQTKNLQNKSCIPKIEFVAKNQTSVICQAPYSPIRRYCQKSLN